MTPKPRVRETGSRPLEAFFAEKGTERDAERFREISIPGYERLGAPRVGFDQAANDWILEVREAGSGGRHFRQGEVVRELHQVAP